MVHFLHANFKEKMEVLLVVLLNILAICYLFHSPRLKKARSQQQEAKSKNHSKRMEVVIL